MVELSSACHPAAMAESDAPFLGSEAVSTGRLKRDALRRRHQRLCPNVYVPRSNDSPSLDQRIRGAWLWSQRAGVIAGSAAAAMHGAKWIDSTTPVEMIYRNPRAPSGVITRRDLLLDGEVHTVSGLAVTTPARTAFDLGRRGPLVPAVARVDALMQATGVPIKSIAAVAASHRHVRGLRQLELVLDLADAGAQSPKESWLRVTLVGGGLPRPHSQIPVYDDAGYPIAFLDLGWPDFKVAVEYDGDHHRADRRQYVKDVRRREMLERRGWIIITVVAEDRPADILRRVRDALARRLSVR